MNRYLEYKDSGIEWVGKIPKDWALKRLKFVSKINPSRSLNISENTQCAFIPMAAMNTDGNFDQSERHPLSKLKSGFTYFVKDDVIFAKITPCFENGKGALLANLESEIGFGSTEFHVLRPGKGWTLSAFLYYITISGQFRRIGEAFMQGVAGQKRVTNDFVENYVVAVPSVDEQKIITDYLDCKTAQIDDLIAKKKRMIELLKEERMAVINQAVTKGLDPNVEMKDSGIEWLGKIPKHWKLKKLKYVVRINKDSLSETVRENYAFNYIDIGSVDLEEGFNLGEKINFVDAPSRARRIVSKGDTIISTVRTYLKAIAYIENDVRDMIVSTGFAVVCPGSEIESEFLYYVLRSEKIIDRICAISVGVSYPAINASDLSNTVIWYPKEKEEQKRITQQLDRELLKSKRIIQKLYSEIELFQEYRTSLISEVVTGKIDVRGGS